MYQIYHNNCQMNPLLLDKATFIQRLFAQSNVEIQQLLYDTVNDWSDTQRHKIAQHWSTRLKWNQLPDVLWCASWNWLTQYEYRCCAIVLNRQTFRISNECVCLPRTSIVLKNPLVLQTQSLLLTFDSITSLEIDNINVFLNLEQSCIHPQIPAVVRHVEKLSLTGPTRTSVALLVELLQLMPRLKSVRINGHITSFGQSLVAARIFALSNAVVNLQELCITDRLDFVPHWCWIESWLSSGYLRRLHINNCNVTVNFSLEKICKTTIKELVFEQCLSAELLLYVDQCINLEVYEVILPGRYGKASDSLSQLKNLKYLRRLRLNNFIRLDISTLCHSAFTQSLQELHLDSVMNQGSDRIAPDDINTILISCMQLRSLSLFFAHYYQYTTDPELCNFITGPMYFGSSILETLSIAVAPNSFIRLDYMVLAFVEACIALSTIHLTPPVSSPVWKSFAFQNCFHNNNNNNIQHKSNVVGGRLVANTGRIRLRNLLKQNSQTEI